MSIKFVGLHAHTTFSIGDAIGYPKDHFDFALENGMDALTITDHGNCNSFGYIVQAQKAYKKKGVAFKPIFGLEGYIHPSLSDWAKLKENKQENEEEAELVVENEDESKKGIVDLLRRRHHLVVIAQNQQGLENIFKLVSKSYREGFYRYPRIDFEMLKKNNEGLIISTACIAGLPSWLVQKEKEKGSEVIQNTFKQELLPLLDIFGKDRAFLELQFNSLEEQKLVNKELIKFSKESGYKLIATADSHYARPQWWRDRELYKMMAKQSKGWKADQSLPETVEDLKCELYPKNGDQMFESYKNMYDGDCEFDDVVKEAIERTYDIAHNDINALGPDGNMKLPKVEDAFTVLKNLCIEKMKSKGFEKDPVYINRLATELKVIREKNFCSYFLVLNRAIQSLRKNILIGPAKGSGAGSLVCYLLGITQLDPIKNGLLFERFLSIHRSGAPDIDTDIEDKDICLNVLKDEFGENNVVPVSNFNTLQLKSLVKDISKFYNIPYMDVNEVTTKMEDEARQKILDKIGGDQKFYVFDLENAKEFSPTFQKFLTEYPKVAEHIEILFKQIKSIGRHAGGVIICDEAECCMPIIRNKKIDQTPWTEGLTAQHLEEWGLIKFDFLGLATLRFIRKCIELILKKDGIKPTIENVYDFYNRKLHPDIMNRSDDNVFEHVYRQGRFPGIFQFTEINAQNFCKRALPESVDDISAITSIWRPGPLCLSGDTHIICSAYTKRGHKIRKRTLKDLYESFAKKLNKTNYYISSYDEKDGKIQRNKILDVVKSGYKKVYKLTYQMYLQGSNNHLYDSVNNKFTGGKPSICRASGDHKFFSNNGWKSLNELKKNDYLLMLCPYKFHNEDPRKNVRKIENIQGRKRFRDICFRNYVYKCVFCDWDKGTLDVNHIDGSRNLNNHFENLCFLCPNHHRMFTENSPSCSRANMLSEREKLRLPKLNNGFIWVRLDDVQEDGFEQTYDISVQSPNNNFFAGNLLVHNSGHADKKYVDRHDSNENIVYDHPILEEVLGDTRGLLIYQEQFMLLANKLAGFALDEADNLRKLLMKPITSLAAEMKNEREEAGKKFIDGCISNGLLRERAEKLWNEEILGFISYGFNKSHAMAYAYISYQCAWLFTYYEKEWIKAYLETDSDRDKAIADVSSVGYKLGKLDVNRSGPDWEIEGNIVFPSLTTVHGIGDVAALEIVEQRQELGGRFESLEQMVYKKALTEKTKKEKTVWRFSKFNKQALSSMIQIEAFDSLDIVGDGLGKFKNYRHMHVALIENYDKLKRGSLKIDQDLLDETACNDWNNMEKIDIQKKLLGTYDKSLLFSDKVLEIFRENNILPLTDLDENSRYIWFILKDYEQKQTANGKPYWKLKISDVDDKTKTLNYFGEDVEMKTNCIYVGTLLLKNGWINTAYKTKLIKVSQG